MEFALRVQETHKRLLASCEAWGICIAGDGSVSEPDAERLLGYQDRALKQQRIEGRCPLPRRKVGNRWRYRLDDISALFEQGFDES